MDIYDIAQEAGVSIATVSRVLNNSPHVSDVTKKKVEEVLKKYNYAPNAIARGLVVKSMKTVGIITIDIRDIYFANVAYIIEQELSKLGYNAILSNTGGDIDEKIKYIRMLTERKVDGLIFVGSVFKDKRIERYIADVSKNLPVVMVNGFNEEGCTYSILCDDAYGVVLCVDHLYAMGRRDIVYLQDAETYSGQSKSEGFKSGLQKYGLALQPYSLLRVEKGLAGGYRAVEQLIDAGCPFTAIIAGEDITAVGALKKLKEVHKRVPDDIAVIGFNNSVIAQCCEPELTSVDSKMDTMGISAVRILKDVFEGRNVSSKTVITPELILRKSTQETS